MPQSVPSFIDMLAECRQSAVHLEMRDAYAIGDEADEFEAWQRGHRTDWDDRASWWHPYYQAVSDAVARGVVVRRARVVSEPVSAYVRYEYELTSGHNVKAGEAVRWLPRTRANTLLLPGNDLWLFDFQTEKWIAIEFPGTTMLPVPRSGHQVRCIARVRL